MRLTRRSLVRSQIDFGIAGETPALMVSACNGFETAQNGSRILGSTLNHSRGLPLARWALSLWPLGARIKTDLPLTETLTFWLTAEVTSVISSSTGVSYSVQYV